MKALDQREFIVAANANGGNGNHWRQHFEIEESDVGQSRNDHRGSPNHRPSIDTRYTFKRSDVGRRICVQDEGVGSLWHCFTFC